MAKVRAPRRPSAIGGRQQEAHGRRIRRERHTVEVMVRMYCAGHHAPLPAAAGSGEASVDDETGLCGECGALLEYAELRVDTCPFGERKPTCVRCTVHCFDPAIREQVRAVMRYSGPRMTLRHPYLAVTHLLDRREA